MFIIEKQGLYYRPESAGYTGLKREAGRFSFEDAACIVGPNGPDGSQDGLSMWAEEETPQFSKSCAYDVKLKEQSYIQGRADGLQEAVKAVSKYLMVNTPLEVERVLDAEKSIIDLITGESHDD